MPSEPAKHSRHDTAGIIHGQDADADWKQTLKLAEQRYSERIEREMTEREERERGRTVPEWVIQVERMEN